MTYHLEWLEHVNQIMQLEHNSDQQIPGLETSFWLSFWKTTVLEGVIFALLFSFEA